MELLHETGQDKSSLIRRLILIDSGILLSD
jgi:hypothetical protein